MIDAASHAVHSPRARPPLSHAFVDVLALRLARTFRYPAVQQNRRRPQCRVPPLGPCFVIRNGSENLSLVLYWIISKHILSGIIRMNVTISMNVSFRNDGGVHPFPTLLRNVTLWSIVTACTDPSQQCNLFRHTIHVHLPCT